MTKLEIHRAKVFMKLMDVYFKSNKLTSRVVMGTNNSIRRLPTMPIFSNDKRCCSVCGETTPYRNPGEFYLCNRCNTHFHFICFICGKKVDGGQYNFSATGHPICYICLSRYSLTTCLSCGRVVDQNHLRNDLCPICSYTMGWNLTRCNNCNGKFTVFYVYPDMRVNGFLCERCFSCINDIIHSYTFKPAPLFHTADGIKLVNNNRIYLGLEIEFEMPGIIENGRVFAEEMNREMQGSIQSHFYFKTDASLYRGLEIITHPMDLDYLKSSDMIDEILKYLFEHGCTASNSTCGLHIHISRNCDNDTYKLMRSHNEIKFGIFINLHRTSVIKLARRTNIEQAKFKVIPSLDNITDLSFVKETADRHESINWQNYSTIEIRVFKGTLSKEIMLASVEFILAVADFSMTDISIDTIMNRKHSWEEFINFITDKNEYGELYTYISNVSDGQMTFE